MSFEGIDWTELSKYFGIINNSSQIENETQILEETKNFLRSALHTDREKEVADILRTYIRKLYKNSRGIKDNAPIWKGMLEVKGDFTIIKYSILLLDHMWY